MPRESDARWPWPRTPREAPLTVDGNVEGAMAFGLAKDKDALDHLTAMLCSGIPDELGCCAIWSQVNPDCFALTVQQEDVNFTVKFIRTDEGLVVEHDAYYIPQRYHRGGNGIRHARDLAHVCDDLDVSYVSVHAGAEAGSYAWARLGAKAIDAAKVRADLIEIVKNKGESWGLGRGYSNVLILHIKNLPDRTLMFDVAQIRTESKLELGEKILEGYPWNGVWDLREAEIIPLVREALHV